MTATEAGSRLRLVFLVRNLEAGGVQRSQSRLAGAIAARGHPVVGPELDARARAPLDHPWFMPGEPPVVLGAGRLGRQKDFPTLIRAFSLLHAGRRARLVILGGAREERRTAAEIAELSALARSLGVADDVALPGPEANPFRFMARSAVFALSSAWEGFGNVLVEAMACGCPVVSTDCPSGPAEILEGGRWGRLAAVGDAGGMARALERTLDDPMAADALKMRAASFSVDRAADSYLQLLGQP